MKYLIYIFVVVMIGVSWVIIITGVIDKIPSRQFTIIPEEESVRIEVELIGWREVTAYSSCPDETDDTPFITAYNTEVRDGIIATNEFPKGVKLLIDGKVYVVEDKTNSRFNYLIDIWMPSKQDAKEWGRQVLEVGIIIEDRS